MYIHIFFLRKLMAGITAAFMLSYFTVILFCITVTYYVTGGVYCSFSSLQASSRDSAPLEPLQLHQSDMKML